MTSSPMHRTPLERWKQLAEAENAAMQAGHGKTRRAPNAAPDKTAPDKTEKAEEQRPVKAHTQGTQALSREVLRLFHEERCAFSEIARRLSLPPRQVWPLLRLARCAQQHAPHSTTLTRPALTSARDKDGTMEGTQGATQGAAQGRAPPHKTSQHLARQLAPLFDVGKLPQDVVAQIAVSEADAWRGFAVWLVSRQTVRKGRKRPARFYRLRLQRIQSLMAEGMSRTEATARLGLDADVLSRDKRRLASIP